MIALRFEYLHSQGEKDYGIVTEKIKSLFQNQAGSRLIAERIKTMLTDRYDMPEMSIGEAYSLIDGIHKANQNIIEVFAVTVDPNELVESYLKYNNDENKSVEEKEKHIAKLKKGDFEMYCIVKINSDSWGGGDKEDNLGDELKNELQFIVSQAAYEYGIPKKKFKKIMSV